MCTPYSKTLKTTAAGAALLIALGLSACGGGGGGGSSSAGGGGTPLISPPAAGNTFTLGGQAAKGLILNGAVTVVDAANPATTLVTGTTSATDGSYSLVIPESADFDGPFVRVIITGGPGATMICDAPAGCGPIAFGDPIAIDNSVSISAIVPSPADNGSSTVNVTALTDMAAALAGAGGNVTTATLDAANGKVAGLFGLVSNDLSGLPVVNIADATSDASSADGVIGALISGGILAAALENPGGIGAALATLSSSFATNGGEIIRRESTDDTAVISLEEIVGGASAAADKTPITGETVTDAGANLALAELEARSGASDTLSDTPDAVVSTATDLEKAKTFVTDLRLVTANNDARTADGDVVQAAIALLEEDATDAAEVISDALDAFDDARSDYVNVYFDNLSRTDAGLPLLPVPTTGVYNGLTVTFESASFSETSTNSDDFTSYTYAQNENFELKIDQTANGNVIDLTYAITESYDNSGQNSFQGSINTYSSTDTESSSLNIVGSVQTPKAVITITELDYITDADVSNRDRVAYSRGSFQASKTDSTGSIAENRIGFIGSIESLENSGLRFEGNIDLSVLGYTETKTGYYEGRYGQSGGTEVQFSRSTTSYAPTSIGLSGTFESGGNRLDLSAIVSVLSDLEIVETPKDIFEAFSYTVANDVITSTGANGDVRIYELLSVADAQSRIAALQGDIPAIDLSGFKKLYWNDDGTDISAYSNFDPDSTDKVLHIEYSNGRNDFFNIALEFDNTVAQPVSDTDIVEALNTLNFAASSLVCMQSAVETDYSLVYVLDEPIVAEGGTQDGITLATGISSEQACFALLFGSDRYTYYNPASTSDITSGDVTLALSVTQDYTNLDANNSAVTFQVYGAGSAADPDNAGLRLILKFGQRRFATNTINLADLDAGTTPVTVTNQDNVVMTLTPDANGDVTGALTVNGVQQATINDDLIVTYTDDTFVSLQ